MIMKSLKSIRGIILRGGGITRILNELNFIKHLLIKQSGENLNVLFDVIYETDYWSKGSGPGSDERLCAGYVEFLQNFFKQHDIKSIVDAGCGDWQFSKNINFDGIHYQGFDVASFVIKANSAKYTKENVQFNLYDGDFTKLPSADLLICKDVLQHLPIAKIHEFISILPKFKYALITNSVCDGEINGEIMPTEFRFLDLSKQPFNLDCKQVFEIKGFSGESLGIRMPVMLWKNNKK